MALIDYTCLNCGFIDEYMTGCSAPSMKAPEVCPVCLKGKMKPIYSSSKNVGLKFIGSGFYCNDYGKNKPISEKSDILND
jgi:predicted nucleic acid-binding Zn ribbon protein